MASRAVRVLSTVFAMLFAAALPAAAQVDITASNLTGPAGSAPGDTITFNFTITNSGIGTTGVWSAGYYLSTNNLISILDTQICVSAGTATSGAYSFTCVLPANLADGAYYMGIIVDLNDQVVETDESNNAIASAAQITICTDAGREPNGSRATATGLTGTTTIANAYICGPKDRDFYALTVSSGQTITAALVPPGMDYDLYLEDATGATVTASTLSGTATDSLLYTVPLSGTYYLRVIQFSGFSPTTPYTLRVQILDPLALAISPGRPWDAVPSPTSVVRTDSALIVLSGINASSAGWSATHRLAATWNTVTSGGGTGSGFATWTRNTSGLAIGTYLDTFTVTATGALGSPAVFVDTLAIAPATQVVSPGTPVAGIAGAVGTYLFYSFTVPAGAVSLDVSIAGLGDADLYLNQGALPTANIWACRPFIGGSNEACPTISAPTIGTWYVMLKGYTAFSGVTLTVTVTGAPTAALTLSNPADWHAVPVSITATGSDSTGVLLTGATAASTAWTATHSAAATWNSLTTSSGTGPGTARWTRSSSGLTAGLYVDTITVTAAATGSPARFLDTLVVTAAPTALTSGVAVNALGGAAGSAQYFAITAPIGTTQFTAATSGGSGGVFLYVFFQQQVSGFTWFAASEISNTTSQSTGFVTPSGFNAATPVFVIVRGSGSFSNVSLTATASSPLTLTLFNSLHRDSVPAGATALRPDSQFVTLGGTGAVSAAWTATHRAAATWNALTTAGGTGPGYLRWTRNPTGLTAGLYVDSIVVTAAGALNSPWTMVDSFRITAATVTLVVTPPAANWHAGALTFTATGTDSAAVTLSGTGSSSTTWAATHRATATWNTLTTSGGTGSGLVRWSRSTSGLGVGTYIDTVTVTATATGSPASFVDTLVVAPAPTALTSGVAVTNIGGAAGSAQFFALTWPTGSTQISYTTSGGTGDVSLYFLFTSDMQRLGPQGGSATIGSNTETIIVHSNVGIPLPTFVLVRGEAAFSGVTLTGTVSSPLTLLLSELSRRDTAPAGTTALRNDSVAVVLTGTGASTATWTATQRAAATWLTLTTTGGTGSGTLRWSRNPTGLAAGVYLDSITVTAAGALNSPWVLLDSFVVLTPTATLALSESSSSDWTSPSVGDNPVTRAVIIQLTGATGSTTTWTGTHRAAATWNTFPQGTTGTGSGALFYRRDRTGLAAGIYLDTMTISAPGAAGSPAQFIDTLVVAPSTQLTNATPVANLGGTVGIGQIFHLFIPAGQSGATVTTSGGAGSVRLIINSGGNSFDSRSVPGHPFNVNLTFFGQPDTVLIVVVGGVGGYSGVTLTATYSSTSVLVLSPPSRWHATNYNASHGSDSAQVTLTGASPPWTASRSAGATYDTVLTTSGNGNATVYWTRNAGGLTSGMHLDTITVTSAGATGSPARLIDTLIVLPFTSVLASGTPFTVGNTGTGADIYLLIVPAGTMQWSVTTSGGTGSLQLSVSTPQQMFGFRTGCLSANAGTTQSCSATIPGGTTAGDTLTVILHGTSYGGVTLTGTVTTPLTLTVLPASRRDTVTAGALTTRSDSASVLLAGTGAASTAWSATHRSLATWVTLTTAGGTGTGTVRWSRNSSGLAAGTYVDTITVTASGAAGSPANIIDTLNVLSTTLTLALSPNHRLATTGGGSSTAIVDSADVQLGGTAAGSTAWTATHRAAATWNSLTVSGATGSAVLRWSRNPTGLAVGSYIDTITVTATGAVGSPARLVDTLIIAAPLTLALSPGVRRDTIVVGATGTRADSAAVTLSGFGSASATWAATHRAAATWISLTADAGTASGTVKWTRAYTGLAAGTYVDTIAVTVAGASGSPARLVDTLVVLQSLALAVSPGGRKDSSFVGLTGTRADSATITLSGQGSAGAVWTVTHRAAATWSTISTAAGAGGGKVRWTRSYNGLAAGTYLDTITVTVAGASGSPARVIDTLLIQAVPISTTQQVADGILNGGGLTPAQMQYLDALGNKNGQFDLGDFLAWATVHPNGVDGGTIADVVDALGERGPVRLSSPAGRVRTTQQLRKGGQP
jgi:hypothetical protein